MNNNEAKQFHDYSDSNAKGSTFWMTLKDLCKYFYIITLNYNVQNHKLNFCTDQCFSFKWCAVQIDNPATEKDCFFTLHQMNDRFMGEGDGGTEDYEYAEMQMILTKVVKVPPKGVKKDTGVTGECAFVEGGTGDLYNDLIVKIDKMTAGNYILFFTANFKPDQLCRRLNVIFHSPHEVKMKRVSAKRFGMPFLADLERRNFKRFHDENYTQPNF